MNKDKAKELLENVTSRLQLTRADHDLILTALEALHPKKKPEEKKPEVKPEEKKGQHEQKD